MESEIIQWLASDNGLLVHITLLVLLILGGLGLPIPEDIPLLLAGVAAANEIVSLRAVLITCYIGVVLGDQIMYFIGRYFGPRLLTAGKRSRLFPALNRKNIAFVREGLRKRRLLYIFIARHLFPLRSMTFLSAGALQIPFWEFLLADALAALISTLIMVTLGFWLGGHLTAEATAELAHQANYYIVVFVILLGLALIGYFFYRKRKRKHQETAAAEKDAVGEPPPSEAALEEQRTNRTVSS